MGAFVFVILLLSSHYATTHACTGVRLVADDGSVVYGRSMEWGAFDLSKPGKYKVRWCYEPGGEEGPWVGKLISNEVQVEIVADSAADGPRR